MVEEEEKKRKKKFASTKSRMKPVQVQCDSDDDEPIGSLLKFKKSLGAKRTKRGSGLVPSETRAEDQRAEVGESRGMDDTLASFAKKLKRPKKVKSSCSLAGNTLEPLETAGPSVVDPTEGAVSFMILQSCDRLEDQGKGEERGLQAGKKLKDYVSATRQDSCPAPVLKHKDVPGAVESLDRISENKLKDTLSSFVRKARSRSKRKLGRESSRVSRIDLTNSEPVLDEAVCATSLKSLDIKSEKEVVLAFDGRSLDQVLVDGRRETAGSSLAEHLNPIPAESSQDALFFPDGKTIATSAGMEPLENTDYGFSKNSDRIQKESMQISPEKNCYGSGQEREVSLLPIGPGFKLASSEALQLMEKDLKYASTVNQEEKLKVYDSVVHIFNGTTENISDGSNPYGDRASKELHSSVAMHSCTYLVSRTTHEFLGSNNAVNGSSNANTSDFIHHGGCSSVSPVSDQNESHKTGADGLNFNLENTFSEVHTLPSPAPNYFRHNSGQTPCHFEGLGHSSEDSHKVLSTLASQSSSRKQKRDVTISSCDDHFDSVGGGTNGDNIQMNDICLNKVHVENLDFCSSPSKVMPDAHPSEKLNKIFNESVDRNLDSCYGFYESTDGHPKDFEPVQLQNSPCNASNVNLEETFRYDCNLNVTHDVTVKDTAVHQNNDLKSTFDVSNHSFDRVSTGSITSNERSHVGFDQNIHLDDIVEGLPCDRTHDLLFDHESKETISGPQEHDLKVNTDDTCQIDLQEKVEKQSDNHRSARRAKKHRHGDMAYEGDIDWETLMHEQGFFEKNSIAVIDQSTRSNAKAEILSLALEEVNNGSNAAVAAGLKANSAGPAEKIKFKEFLKRRGGHQEYIECRNLILGLWSRDMRHILPLAECGVCDSPTENESQRASLIREIYSFLDRCGYINFGIATEKDMKPCLVSQFELANEAEQMVNCGGRVPDTEYDGLNIPRQVRHLEIQPISRKVIPLDMDALAVEKCTLSTEKLELSNVDPHHIVSGMDAQVVHASLSSDSGKFIADSSSLQEPLSGFVTCMQLKTDEGYICEPMEPNIMNASDDSCTHLLSKSVDGELDGSAVKNMGASCCVQPGDDNSMNAVHGENIKFKPFEDNLVGNNVKDSEIRKQVIIIGAGPAGLTAGRHLQRQGFSVCVLEGRDRIGGRVHTDHSSLSVPVDLGASIITGVEADVATERRPDPSSLISAQLGLELSVLNSDCPLYDIMTGQKVPGDLDEALEAEFNSLLDDMVVLVDQKGDDTMMSLEEGLENALRRRREDLSTGRTKGSSSFNVDTSLSSFTAHILENGIENEALDTMHLEHEVLSPLERRVMDWHLANLEYGCAALLKDVSLPHWNQDDVYGGFGGAHCMIKGGYGAVVASLAEGLDVYLNHAVTEVTYKLRDVGGTVQQRDVKVYTSSGTVFLGDVVLITVPLGCLKANTIRFSPSLPDWKQLSIRRLGFGVLNKIVLEFPVVFWDDTIDYFGATAEETDRRGQCFMFWNIKKTVGAPVLIALLVGKAAIDGQDLCSSEHVSHAMMVLRKIFGDASVPEPIASVVTNWGRDPFSMGAYSYVAVGASGEDYDILARPVANCLFFAGEATCKEHPDTVGGAMMSGLREAVRIINILTTGDDYTTEVENIKAGNKQSNIERNEVRSLLKRLDSLELSNFMCKNSQDGEAKSMTNGALLQDIFSNVKTTAARLHLVKEMLRLPVGVLKSFAGTKDGLTILNSWILDSMGKDGTQLLRHCVRLLVFVSTDLMAVRSSGIGKTIKEKVCVHTSRDIRAVASQLVSMWIEVFRKVKASNGRLKLLKQTTASYFPKARVKETSSGKPHLGNDVLNERGSVKTLPSTGDPSSFTPNNKILDSHPAKFDHLTETKSEVKLANSSHFSCNEHKQDFKMEENSIMSEEEVAAFAAAEAAHAAALAAAKAYASSEADYMHDLPKIPSFHKFARREQYAQLDDSDPRERRWLGDTLGRQDCVSQRARNWSLEFSSAHGNIENSRMSGDNCTHSNDAPCHLDLKEHSGESVAVDSRFTKAWVDSAGSCGVKDYHAIDLWQSQALDADPEFFCHSLNTRDEEDSNRMSRLSTGKNERQTEESSVSQEKGSLENQPRGSEHVKQAVFNYVASLLMPLYKARKIDKEGYKIIMKKSTTKVMDQRTDMEKMMTVSEFLDFKRRNKIRSFVDKLIERHMEVHPMAKT